MDKRFVRSAEVVVEELLPGISNDITLALIVTKLSWRDFNILSSVSRRWQHAIQSHAVYDARVQSRSTETLAVVGNCRLDGTAKNRTIALYSTKDKTLNELPPIPGLDGEGKPRLCQCVSSDGNLYVLGGTASDAASDAAGRILSTRSEVYVLDLAGQRQWRRCANMKQPRVFFGSGAIQGQIYVFGGQSSSTGPLASGEVFDPKVNAWSQITPMPTLHVGHEVSVTGEELFMHGGLTCELDANGKIRFWGANEPVEIYNPIKDEWRLNGSSDVIESPRALAAQGKLHLMDDFDTYVHHMGTYIDSAYKGRIPLARFRVITTPDFYSVNRPYLMTTIQL